MHPTSTLPTNIYRMPPPTAGGINEPQECPYCRRTFSCYYSLKRHFQDKHEQSDTLYVCEFCNRRYRTKNSLTTHKSLQHRGSSGMLKRLLKTSAMKSVLAAQHHPPIQQQLPQWKWWSVRQPSPDYFDDSSDYYLKINHRNRHSSNNSGHNHHQQYQTNYQQHHWPWGERDRTDISLDPGPLNTGSMIDLSL